MMLRFKKLPPITRKLLNYGDIGFFENDLEIARITRAGAPLIYHFEKLHTLNSDDLTEIIVAYHNWYTPK